MTILKNHDFDRKNQVCRANWENVNNLSGKDSLIGVNRERDAIPRNSHFALAYFCLKNAQNYKKKPPFPLLNKLNS